jgi:ketosteroid isomerase-like protein
MGDHLNKFFTDYGNAAFEPDKIAEFYGDFAVASTPSFVGCLKGEKEIMDAFENIAEYQKKTGLISMKPDHIEAVELDVLHVLAKVRWTALFDKTRDQPVNFDVTYLLRREKDRPRILLYIAHQDEAKMREELGIA